MEITQQSPHTRDNWVDLHWIEVLEREEQINNNCTIFNTVCMRNADTQNTIDIRENNKVLSQSPMQNTLNDFMFSRGAHEIEYWKRMA